MAEAGYYESTQKGRHKGWGRLPGEANANLETEREVGVAK